MITVQAIAWSDRGIRVLDQTHLPDDEVYVDLATIEQVAEAIRSLRVRGAPLIGITAAMGFAVAAGSRAERGELTADWLTEAADTLEDMRPTAVDLRWALDRMRRVVDKSLAAGHPDRQIASALREEAQRIWNIEIGMCRSIGERGAALIEPGFTVLTHCNTGALATGGLGTALAAVYVAHEQGKGIDVVATETRPLRQGARLTAWELAKARIPCRVIVDGAAAALMAKGEIDIVITGADRIVAGGDVANKIGTYALAVLARAHGIPFYVAAPRSTFDFTLDSGSAIPIEQRGSEELPTAPGVRVHNPAFDVTPAEMISGIVTDDGLLLPPLEVAIREYGRR